MGKPVETTGWLWVARPRVCRGCRPELELEDRTIDAGDLAYITRTGAVRCLKCAEDLLGVCLLSYDDAPRERLDHAVTPPAPTLYELPATETQPTVSRGELLRRNRIRAQAIARWKERRK